MTESIRRKNFLVLEGRSLATGKRGQLTAEEWLYLYNQVKDDLVGAQVRLFAELETRILSRHRKLKMNAVSL